MSFETVEQFERSIAEYYNAPYAVATDCCTHAIELSLRYTEAKSAYCPSYTYLSIPMTFEKLNIDWSFNTCEWKDFYNITSNIIDAAVYWHKGGYKSGSFMCLSFQYKKHLSLGRGGAILCESLEDYIELKKMSYDGRVPNTPWTEQDIDSIGYHYYMTPETAQLGLDRLDHAKMSNPRKWTWEDYPDLRSIAVFKKNR